MAEPGYPAARAVAPRIQEHFVRHRSVGDGSAAELPPVEAIEAIIDAAFWASLRREEGYVPRISLALLPPEAGAAPAAVRAAAAAQLERARARRARGRAARHPSRRLAVGPSRELKVWGTTRTVPDALLRPRGRRAGTPGDQTSSRRRREVRQRRRPRRRSGQGRRRAGIGAARLPVAADVAARLRHARGDPAAVQRPGGTRRLDARARPRRIAPGGAR